MADDLISTSLKAMSEQQFQLLMQAIQQVQSHVDQVQKNLDDFKFEMRDNFRTLREDFRADKQKLEKVYEARDKVKITFGWQWGMASLMIAIVAVGMGQVFA